MDQLRGHNTLWFFEEVPYGTAGDKHVYKRKGDSRKNWQKTIEIMTGTELIEELGETIPGSREFDLVLKRINLIYEKTREQTHDS